MRIEGAEYDPFSLPAALPICAALARREALRLPQPAGIGGHAGIAPRISLRLELAKQPHGGMAAGIPACEQIRDRKSTRLNSSHGYNSYAVFCLKKKN